MFRAVASLGFVLATSRSLGASGFGSLAALSSLTSLAVSVAISGFNHALTQLVAQSRHEPTSASRGARRSIVVAALALVAPFGILAGLLPGVTVTAAIALFLIDVPITGLAETMSSRFVGERRFSAAFLVLAPVAVGRLAAAAVVWLTPVHTLQGATVAALIGGAAGFVVALTANMRLLRSDRPQRVDRPPYRRAFRLAALFGTGNVVNRAGNDADKVLLSASLGEIPAVGSYAIAYRLAEYAAIPMTALSAAAYPRLFRAGADSLESARHASRALRTRYLVTGAATSLVIVAAIPLATPVFGDSYPHLSQSLLALAMLPMVRAVNNYLAEPLTGAGRHGLRVWVWTAALVANLAANVVLIPIWGIFGAVAATYVTEATQFAILVWLKRRLAPASM